MASCFAVLCAVVVSAAAAAVLVAMVVGAAALTVFRAALAVVADAPLE